MRQLRKCSISYNSGSATVSASANASGSASASDYAEKYFSKLPLGIQKALDPNKKATPLDELIRAASIQNPKQFELPRELELHVQFPGYDRGKCRNSKNLVYSYVSSFFSLFCLGFLFQWTGLNQMVEAMDMVVVVPLAE